MSPLSSTSQQRKAAGTSRRFAQYDGRRFVFVAPQFKWGLLRGTARYERDDLLGNVLRIPVEGDSPGKPEIVLAEDDWNGLITKDAQYGCDYCVTIFSEAG